MSGEDLRRALMTKAPVIWRGRMDYERAHGYVSAIVYRCEDRKQIQVSCEITQYGSIQSGIRARAEDVEFWHMPDAGQADGAYTENTASAEKGEGLWQGKEINC
jgi:hypothetical protein